MLNQLKREQISRVIIKVLYSRFQSFPTNAEEVRNAPFHVAFIKAFQNRLEGRVSSPADLITLSSWMQGLNTSLGQSFFEAVAHIICDGEKRTFKDNLIYVAQARAINEHMVDLKNCVCAPSLKEEYDLIVANAYGDTQISPNFTADCYYETDSEVVAVELKSVRPNSGEIRGEKMKVLQAKAVLQSIFPGKKVSYFFGFPFDPTASSATDYNKSRFLQSIIEAEKFLAEDDILIADNLWSFLAGEQSGVMDEILALINNIATPAFMDKFMVLQNSDRGELSAEVELILREWNLLQELQIWQNMDKYTNPSQRRIFAQHIFSDADGKYNHKRLELL